ncbi:hypothetical protein V6N11_008164 [Hibiscus sabdariffa]|uniref:Uncharacterized protein n=1 Tax=Hibiscus sabdariffa TaxID=183260 RepID=A0ABR2PZT6_9ROSI
MWTLRWQVETQIHNRKAYPVETVKGNKEEPNFDELWHNKSVVESDTVLDKHVLGIKSTVHMESYKFVS